MAGVIATIPKFQFSANGVPMVGGTLDTYIAGSTTPATTWQDSALTIANTNPISLDARGECVLWLDSTKSYKFVLKNASGVIQWTQDNISGAGSLADKLRTDLAASSGASLVGGAGQVVSSIAGLRALLKTSASKNAFVTGYYAAGDGGGGAYWYDSTDTTSADNGGSIIVATDGGRWKLRYSSSICASQFGAIGDGVTDCTTALAACATWAATFTFPPKITFRSGTYKYSACPNFAIPHLVLYADGEVILNYTGTGVAFNFDSFNSGNTSTFIYDVEASNFIIDAPLAYTGLWTRNVVHSRFHNIKIKSLTSANGGTPATRGAGFRLSGSILNTFTDCECSINTFPSGIMPFYGLYLDDSTTNGTRVSTANTFVNPKLEGAQVGVYLADAQSNVFLGGTAEACGIYGIADGGTSFNNTFIGMGLEANTTEDFYLCGSKNTILNCYKIGRAHV